MSDEKLPAERDETTIVIFDLETTGTDPARDEIVELCAQIGLGAGAESWTCRMRPSQPIPPEASSVHGIRDADVASCERFPAHADRLRQLLTGADVLVGYNLAFDLAVLDAELERHALPPLDLSRTHVVDAFALWRRVEPRTLSGAHQRFAGDRFEGAHRASEDVAATGRVLLGMLAAFGLEGEPWGAIAERAEPGRRRWIGPTGHLEWRAGVPVVTFGRHRGRALDVVAREEGGEYLRWLLDQRFPAHVKRIARLALELEAGALKRRLVSDHGAPASPDGPSAADLAAVDPQPQAEADGAAEHESPTSNAVRGVSSPGVGGGNDPPATPVILFDGVCNLCAGWVAFVIARDPHARFRFASLQSAAATRLLAARPDVQDVDSIVLVEANGVHVRSSAALRILRTLGGGWAMLHALWIVPRPLRDLVYDLIARNRYRWFGRKDACMVPSSEVRERFIDQS